MNFISQHITIAKRNLIILTMVLCCVKSFANAQTLPDFTVLAEELLPTVVGITIEQEVAQEDGIEDINLTNAQTSSGSGFIISKDGYIVTNYHVIHNSSKIFVTMDNSMIYDANIVGFDKKTDVAVIKIEPKTELQIAKFGDSDNIKTGQWILAIGNPFGLGGSVTKGIISAKSRDIASGNYDNFIQTDASINRGNSGGPMFNMHGEVIGINTAIFSTNGTSMGIGFAIPANMAQWVIEQIIMTGKVERSWIGVKIQPLTYDMAHLFGLENNQGVIISALTEGSPAQKSGLKVGDVITKANSKFVDNSKSFSRMIAEFPIGLDITFEIIRSNNNKSIMVKTEKMPEESTIKDEDKYQHSDSYYIEELGLTLSPVQDNPLITSGLKIEKVKRSSDAFNKGLNVGDIITKSNNKTLFNINNLKDTIKDSRLDNNSPLVLQVYNNNIMHLVTVELK